MLVDKTTLTDYISCMMKFTHLPTEFEQLKKVTQPSGARHYTTLDGVSYPSVTTILAQHTEPGITKWVQRVGKVEAAKISKRAATKGTKFHELVEGYLNNLDLPELSIFEREIFNIAKPHLDKIDNIRAQEAALFSHHLRLAGTVDIVADYEGRRSIIDLKTSKREKPPEYVQHYFMQAAAYAVMFEERTGIPISNLVLIIAVDDGMAQVMKSKRDLHIKDLLHYRDQYEAKNL